MAERDKLGVRADLSTGEGILHYYSLEKLEKSGYGEISRMPKTVKVFIEAVARQLDGTTVTEDHLKTLAGWKESKEGEFPFKPARVLMQDFTGVPAVVDLAVMRDAVVGLGRSPDTINPLVPVDLVIDHSVQVDRYGSTRALAFNAEREFQRNAERYEILNWASKAFDNFSVVPPATGICHQVNLEYLANVVQTSEGMAFPDTLVGTDSHTTMVNGLGVLGWGGGGIEAEAAMLGQPIYMPVPEVIGVRLKGELKPGVTATDLVLTVTQILREYGVVGRFVEFFGDGLDYLDLPDRATISNMCPEYGATAALFPVDNITLRYMKYSGRPSSVLELVEAYTKEQGLFRSADSPDPSFTDILELDMGTVTPSIAGPKRPQDRIPLEDAKTAFQKFVSDQPDKANQAEGKADKPVSRAANEQAEKTVAIRLGESEVRLGNGSVVIAAITSCTNTSNPSVLIGAGLLAKKAVELGLRVPPFVKTSLAPGSKVVTRYLDLAGLTPYLEALGFHTVGYGCTTCIGNSGPLLPEVSRAIKENDLAVASVLSGNRNFEGRIHQEIKANYLASPIQVVAYALAGDMRKDLTTEPVGVDPIGEPVYLKDLWPDPEEIRQIIEKKVSPDLFREEYGDVYIGNETWNEIEVDGAAKQKFSWQPTSTYIRKPPFFDGLTKDLPPQKTIENARVLAVLGDSITTDHISPAGAIAEDSSAAKWLNQQGVGVQDFNTYGSRRGNHEVMMRGTFANIRIRNGLVPGVEGGYTIHLPDGKRMSIFDAAQSYAREGVPLIVIAGKDYGMGSSRDWAAKGPLLLGVTAVIAESYERIHRSNLLGMGVLPLQFKKGENAASLGLTGHETFDIEAIEEARQDLKVLAGAEKEIKFEVHARIDNPIELDYYMNGGILHTLLRKMSS